MSTNFNKLISLFNTINIFCVFAIIIYYIIFFSNTIIIHVDEEQNFIIQLFLNLIVSSLSIYGNHFSKQYTLSILSNQKEIFCYENIDNLEYTIHFIYRFCLLILIFLNLILWKDIINYILLKGV